MIIHFIHSQYHPLTGNMASVLYQLATIILVAIAIQTLVTAEDLQEYEDYEGDESNLLKLYNYQKMLSLHPQLSISSYSNDDFEVDAPTDDVYDDYRQSRSHSSHIHNMEEHFCMMVPKQQILSDNSFEYRPSILEDKYCQSVIGQPDHRQKGICYVRGRDCQTVTREITLFKRQRHGGHCWKPELRNISDGCNCFFERENMGGKSYTE